MDAHARTHTHINHVLVFVLMSPVYYVFCILFVCNFFSKGLTRDRGCKLVLTRNLYVWHLFYILYETMYNVFVKKIQNEGKYLTVHSL